MKLILIQPVVPLYNVPLFERLANVPGRELIILADLETPAQLNQYDSVRHRFSVQHLPCRVIGGVCWRPGLFKLFRRIDPDAVIINGDPREWSQVALMLYCAWMGIPDGIWSMFHRIGPKRWVTEIIMRLFNYGGTVLLSYAERGRCEQLARTGGKPEHMIVLGTAVDEKAIIAARDSVSPDQLSAFRTKWNLQHKHVLLHAVRLTAIKKPHLTLQAFAAICRQRNDVVLVLIGGGPLEEQTRTEAMKFGIADSVKFVGPVYDEQQLACWHLVSDVFIMATCVGLSIHRAMCYGLPVVTDDDPETQASEFELLKHGVNGLTYRAGNIPDYAAKVLTLLDDENLRGRLSLAARATVEQEFTLDRKVRQFEVAIARLSSARKGNLGGLTSTPHEL